MRKILEEIAVWFCIICNVGLFLTYRCLDIPGLLFIIWYTFAMSMTFVILVVGLHRLFGKKLKKLEDEVLHKDS